MSLWERFLTSYVPVGDDGDLSRLDRLDGVGVRSSGDGDRPTALALHRPDDHEAWHPR